MSNHTDFGATRIGQFGASLPAGGLPALLDTPFAAIAPATASFGFQPFEASRTEGNCKAVDLSAGRVGVPQPAGAKRAGARRRA